LSAGVFPSHVHKPDVGGNFSRAEDASMSNRFTFASLTLGEELSAAQRRMQSHLSDPAASRPHTARTPQPSALDPLCSADGERFVRGETIENGPGSTESELFDCGTLLKLRMHPLSSRERGRNIVMRACVVVLAGWLPLLLLAVYQSLALREAGVAEFLSDLAVASRSLLAAPLLVLAEWISLPRLSAIAVHFRESGVVGKADDARFEAAWRSTLRLRDALGADIAVIVLAYAIVAALVSAFSPSLYPAWQLSHATGTTEYSPAGWWHVLVSLPLLFVLLLAWIWRLIAWARFLYLMSRLNLRLVPAHPDRTAGLRFVAYSVQAFSLVALALGVIVAGAAANRILYWSASPQSFKFVVLALVAFVVVVFAGPLLVFFTHLLRAWQRGTLQYSALAGRLGRQFESKWLRHGATIDASTLEVGDFSATTDLYQVASNVYEVRLIPISLTSFGMLVGMTILPFVVIALMFVPVDVIVAELAKLLL
jgi:hypothetical protein